MASGLLSIVFLYLLFSGGTCTPGPPPDENAGLYHTYAEIDAELHELANRFPALATVESIGQSIQGRELWAIKISDNVTLNEDETTVVLVGGHHAREWISIDVPFLIAKHLLGKFTPVMLRFQAWLMKQKFGLCLWSILTAINTRLRMTGCGARIVANNGDGTFGVDLNRNYGHNWGGPGSSGDTFSEIYRGPAPFSEPETQAIRDFVQQLSPQALISYHNFSQLILYPWGNTNQPPPDETLLNELAVAMADRIRSVHNQSYTPQQASELYLASGDTVDWLYDLFAVPGYTIELRPRSSFPGFELPENQIQPTFEENLPAALFLIDWAIQQNALTL